MTASGESTGCGLYSSAGSSLTGYGTFQAKCPILVGDTCKLPMRVLETWQGSLGTSHGSPVFTVLSCPPSHCLKV